ncbi:MAG: DUF2497 domain-containing protein [Holosporaceae bacterium]|nr:DUF2497 domain-containing protein [Holosporaceae bacterium]
MEKADSEMSLDEVLSSIKKMVMDEEPPVLDLTDMVGPDGSIVQIKNHNSRLEMRTFLKMVQENVEKISEDTVVGGEGKRAMIREESTEILQPTAGEGNVAFPVNLVQKDAVALEVLKEIASPWIREWVDSHLPEIIKEIVEEKICDLYKKREHK